MNKIDYTNTTEINFYYPNIELSKGFHNEFKEFIKEKQCYDNVANIFINYDELSDDFPDIKIVYGGMQMVYSDGKDAGFFIRHCFFKYNDEIIDPTMGDRLNKDTKYFSAIEFSIEEYRDFILKHQEPKPMSLMRELNNVALELWKHNIALVG